MYFSSTRVCSWSGLVGTVFFSPAVDPPENLRLFDPGHLGHLEMTWSPPASLTNVTQCLKLYQLEYFNSYTNSWTVGINHVISEELELSFFKYLHAETCCGIR